MNAQPRLLLSVTAFNSEGVQCQKTGLASPITSGVDALDAAIEQLQRSREAIRRHPYLDWHIQINVRPSRS